MRGALQTVIRVRLFKCILVSISSLPFAYQIPFCAGFVFLFHVSSYSLSCLTPRSWGAGLAQWPISTTDVVQVCCFCTLLLDVFLLVLRFSRLP